jgi:tRNA pseudouridine38-40 synthase
MPRFRLDIEYDGSPYAGWQRQAGQHSVQAAIEQAIAGFSGEAVTIRGAGRTDAGVHAVGQVAHVDLAKDWPADTVRDAVNAHLQMAGETVSVLGAARVPDGFDARFSARARWKRAGHGGCRRRSTPGPCMKPRRSWSAATTSPPSARSSARRRAR